MDEPSAVDAGRYIRQLRYAAWGPASQKQLAAGSALIVGAGALGSCVAEILARAGVGRLRIVDRDLLQLDNLHRQTLYTEADAAARLPKVEAIARRLAEVNRGVAVEPLAVQASESNIDDLVAGVDLIVDGTDNFPSRFVLNDAALRHNLPLVHGGALGCDGQVMTVLPGETICLRCLLPEGVPDDLETCDTVGVLMPVVSVVGALQAMECLKLLSGNRKALSQKLSVISLWDNRLRQVELGRGSDSRAGSCPHWTMLRQSPPRAVQPGSPSGQTVAFQVTPVCGREAVQIDCGCRAPLDLAGLGDRLEPHFVVRRSPFAIKLDVDGLEITVFGDGRGLVDGTEDPLRATRAFESSVWVAIQAL
jgi:molybdopterin-synthase adenylyltransferase